MIQGYRYPKPKKSQRVRRTNRLTTPLAEEGLTGLVQGLNASADEERVARGLKIRGLKFTFQQKVKVPTQIEAKNVDFLVMTLPRPTPLEVDGFIGHYTQSQQSKDKLRELIINQTNTGWEQMKQITWRHTHSQDSVNQELRRLFFGAQGV